MSSNLNLRRTAVSAVGAAFGAVAGFAVTPVVAAYNGPVYLVPAFAACMAIGALILPAALTRRP